MLKRIASVMVDVQYPIPEMAPWFTSPCSLLSFRQDELKTLNWLFAAAPCFPVRADNIQIITEPREFYDTILTRSERAERRITFASLYLGTGKLEQKLVNAVDSSLHRRNITFNVLLDYHRGTRGNINSKSLLLPLIQKYENRCILSLYHTPHLRGLYRKLIPQRWNELIGLQHMKIYLIDDTVIMSGANLSNDYFTNRQDRYIVIEDSNLANFYSELIEKIQEFSLNVREDGTTVQTGSLSPYDGDKKDFITKAHESIHDFFESVLEKQIKKGVEHIENADTWIFPLVEMGQLGIHHDSLVTERVISNTLPGSLLMMATGYFNLTKSYMDTIINDSKATCTVLMAHPNANGFQGAKGPAGGIPAAYSLLAKNFYDQLVASSQENRVTMLEYERSGWSFHAKGLWYYLPDDNLPCMTLIGSPNFGERSVNRDLETQIAMVTVNKDMKKTLHEECSKLHGYAKECQKSLTKRKTPRWIKMTVNMFRNYF